MNDNIKALLVLGSYLDTLGFYNGNWEFNFNNKPVTLKEAMLVQNEIVNNYYSLGSDKIDISNWNASDDTIMMIATKLACDKNGSYDDFKNEYLKILEKLKENKRASGYTTINSLELLKKNKKIKYNKYMGGNGAAMRTAYIGIKYKDDIDAMIEKSILSSRMTHNYPLGFLGGLVTALFTSYAIKNINPFEWGKELIKLEKSGKIDKYMKTTDIYHDYKKDKFKFFSLWFRYVEQRLERFSLRSREFLFGADRYNDLLNYTPGVKASGKNDFSKFASTGVGATIVAYDALLMSIMSVSPKIDKIESLNYNWNSLIFYSTLHFGDNDSTGIIAGNWYGTLRGFKDFNINKINNIIEQLEFKDYFM
jgi:ADP-ribosylarginine hydrolase